MELHHITCVACSRKQEKVQRSCVCGHVFHESIDDEMISNEATGVSHRLRKKRYTASLDDSAVDLVLDKLLGVKSRKEPLKQRVYLSLGSNSNERQLQEKSRKQKKRKNVKRLSRYNPIKRKIENSMESCNELRKTSKLSLDCNMNQLSSSKQENDNNMYNNTYRSVLEEINSKLIRQNGICRIAYC